MPKRHLGGFLDKPNHVVESCLPFQKPSAAPISLIDLDSKDAKPGACSNDRPNRKDI